MTFNAFKECVIAECAALGISEYELYYQAGESTSVDTFMHQINEFSASVDGGVCFRCIVGGKMGYASTEDLSAAEAKNIVSKAIDNAAILETEEQVFLGEGGQEYAPLEIKKYDLPTTDELVSTALAAQEKLYAAHPAIIDGCQSNVIAERTEIAIYNSKGLDLHYENAMSGVVFVAVASDGKEMANDFHVKMGKLSDMDLDELAKKAADGAVLKLGGDVAPTGSYPVIFSPEAMSSLLGVYSSIFSSEAAQKGLSKLSGQEETVIAAPCVTILDDPFHPENPVAMNFDAEGSPTVCKAVVENGVFKTLLYNLKTAAVAGKKTTGNASKAGYNASVSVRPFTMYLAGGELSEDELLAKAGEGVMITSLGGLHAGANAISGDFSLQSSGFMIRDGKKAEYVKSFTVAGNFYDLLKDVEAVASNVTLPRAMGVTNFGAPSVLVKGLSVAGK